MTMGFSDIESIFFYVGVVICCFVLALVAGKFHSIVPVVVIAIILIVVSGMRTEEVGIDNSLYAGKHYQHMLLYGANTVSKWYDTYYIYLMELVSQIGTYYLFTLVVSTMTYTLIITRLWELREVASFPVALLTFMCVYWPMSLNISRQFLAVALVFWGSRFFFSKQYMRFSIIIIIAMLIHKISIISFGLFLLLPLFSNELSRTKRTLVTLAGIISPIIMVIVLTLLYTNYAGNYLGSVNIDIGFMGIIKVLFIFGMLMLCKSSTDQAIESNEIKGMVAVATAGVLVAFAGYFFSHLDRIALCFLMYEPILYGYLFKKNSKAISNTTLLFVAVLCSYTLLSSLLSDAQGIVPYSLCAVSELFVF